MDLLQQLADRIAIQDLIVRESNLLDACDFDAYEALFTPDAYIDYRSAGAIDGNPREVRAFLEQIMPTFPYGHHMVGNFEISVDGDTAKAKSMEWIALGWSGTEPPMTSFQGLLYEDELVRTAEGWKFSKRIEHMAWRHHFPGHDLPARTGASGSE